MYGQLLNKEKKIATTTARELGLEASVFQEAWALSSCFPETNSLYHSAAFGVSFGRLKPTRKQRRRRRSKHP